MPALPEMRMEDRSIPVMALPMWVWALMILLFVAPLVLFILLTSHPNPLDFGYKAFVWIFFLILAHESTHALAWKYAAGLPWSVFTFGVMWKTLTPYCHATVPMPIRAYRIGAVTPLLVTGLLPWLLALWAGALDLGFAATLLISAAAGDLYILWTLRDVPAEAQVQDHASQVGCVVLYPA